MAYTVILRDQYGDWVNVTNHKIGPIILESKSKKVPANMSITSNYREFFIDHLDPKKGIFWLYGKTGEESKHRLEVAIKQLGTKTHPDQWKKVPGNAGLVLSELLSWAKQHPKATFMVLG